jgi:hypothetical protein
VCTDGMLRKRRYVRVDRVEGETKERRKQCARS